MRHCRIYSYLCSQRWPFDERKEGRDTREHSGMCRGVVGLFVFNADESRWFQMSNSVIIGDIL